MKGEKTMQKNQEQNRETLLDILESYKRMIDRDEGKHPTAVLSDIEHSIKAVLRQNNRTA